MWWVYFVGTGNGVWVSATNMATAKILFARHNGLPDDSGYIRASRKGPLAGSKLK